MKAVNVAERIWFNGKLLPSQQACVSVYDHGLLYGDGVFEGIRFYNQRIFKLRTHLRRLFESAHSIRLNIPYNADQLVTACRETVEASGMADGYIRLGVTRGAGTLGLNPFVCNHPNVFIIADSITLYDKDLYKNGMEVVTSSVLRNHPAALSPRIKSMNYLNNILAKIEAIDAGVMEAIMLNHQGFVSECTGDNLFIVRYGADNRPVLVTPPLHAGILDGVTRNVVIELAREAGLTVLETDLTRNDVYIAREVFLTGTAAEVIAVTRVDGRLIGDGSPGVVTCQLREAFCRLVTNETPED